MGKESREYEPACEKHAGLWYVMIAGCLPRAILDILVGSQGWARHDGVARALTTR
jgi:hypothetical protein